MNLIKVDSREGLKVILKNARNPTVVVLASEIIKPDDIKKDIPLFNYSPVLIPKVEILNEYLDNGISEVYEKSYFEQLQKPNRMFLINEIVYLMLMSEYDILVTISADEVEYEYLKMFSRFIRITYGYKMLSIEKYLKGKDSKIDVDTMNKKSLEIRASLGNKLADSGYILYELLALVSTKSSIKLFPKEVQKKIKTIWEEQDYGY